MIRLRPSVRECLLRVRSRQLLLLVAALAALAIAALAAYIWPLVAAMPVI